MDINKIFNGPPNATRWRELGEYLRSQKIFSGKGVRIFTSSNGIIISAYSGGRPFVTQTVCPFGNVIEQDGDPHLSGGFVFGGSTNLEVTPIPLNLSSNTGDWLYLAIDFGANTVDGILLPGVDSITGHTISHGSLPSNTIPTMSSTSGKIHIPLGFYTSSTTPGGDATFTPTGCGNITIHHCPGVISFTRA